MAKRFLAEDSPVNELLGQLKDTKAPQVEEKPKTKAVKKTDKGTAKIKPSKESVPAGYKFAEKRTARLQLIFQPSLLDELKSYCKKSNMSVNDYIHQLVERELRG